MEKIQGEQFYRYITGTNIDYDLCSQIVITVYRKETKEIIWNFVKVFDDDYPESDEKNKLLEKSINPDYELQVWHSEDMTKNLTPGVYLAEAKRVIDGEKQPIIKGQTEYLTILKSLTK